MKTVNFGIDLGTTNSLIAKYNEGELEVFKNPIGQKQTLASVVAFRSNRILVGDKARDFSEKDPLNVFSCFKRRMGTTDSYWVENLKEKVSPIDLSSYVLNELKNFIHTGESIQEAVITIPSSFDTIQSNATKMAGKKAGLEAVYLLQEPIAASLAFANKNDIVLTEEKRWLTYDFGGGTFDVALLKLDEREMNVIDNEGDNFLGGMDIDALIIKHLLVPKLAISLKEKNLWDKLTTKDGEYQTLYFELLFKAEEAKKELSRFDTAEIDIDYEDFYETISINKQEFEQLIAPIVEKTINFAKDVLERNQLTPSDIEKIVLVGGSTLIPYVREKLEQFLNIAIDSSVDPTAAVGIGAAYYAGTKISERTNLTPHSPKSETSKEENSDFYTLFYEKNSKDLEELVAIKCTHPTKGFYRIIRKDGGFDTGLVPLEENNTTFVDLLESNINHFNLTFYDQEQQPFYQAPLLSINQGKYNIQGQLLPNDICIEIDDLEFNVTRLQAIFKKNEVLPLKKTLYKSASKTLLKNSDDSLQINIVEGEDKGLPSSGLSIGYLVINGSDLEEDLIKGTDIEIDISISESRDIDVSIFLNSVEQSFQNTFKPTERYISLTKMTKEISMAINKIERELQSNGDEYERMAKFKKIHNGLIELQIEISLLDESTLTDQKFKIDNNKRTFIKQYDQLTRHKDLDSDIEAYQQEKTNVMFRLAGLNNDTFQKQFDSIIAGEKQVLNSGNKYTIKAKTRELIQLNNNLFNLDESNYIGPFLSLKTCAYPNQDKADILIDQGEKALENEQYKIVKHVVYQLYDMLPETMSKKDILKDKDKTGLQ